MIFTVQRLHLNIYIDKGTMNLVVWPVFKGCIRRWKSYLLTLLCNSKIKGNMKNFHITRSGV
jgi:hypothetical protein